MSDGMKPSDDLLIALHGVLGEAMLDPKFGLEFARVTRGLREQKFQRGTRSIQEVVLDGRLRFKVDAGDRLGADVYFGSLREMLAIEAFCRGLEPGDCVIDVGANFGLVSIMAADRIGAHGRVLAFEPDSKARALLQTNVRLNRLGRRVTVVPRSLAHIDGMLPFYRSEESAFSGLADTGRARIEEVESVPAQRLDTAMEEFRVSRVDAMKIDVEGFEYAVLAGGTGALDRAPDPLVMLEVSAKNLDPERRGRLLEVLQGWLAKGWEFWSYRVDRNELVSHATAHEIVEEAPGNVYLARPASGRLQKVRQAYQEIVEKYLLPVALRRQLGLQSDVAQSPHSASRLLWNAFLIEFSQGFQSELRRLEAEGSRNETHEDERVALQQEALNLRAELERARSAAEDRERTHEDIKHMLTADLTSARSEWQRTKELATQLFQELLNERSAAEARFVDANRAHDEERLALQQEALNLRAELESARATVAKEIARNAEMQKTEQGSKPKSD